MNRRRFVAAVGTTLALAGCLTEGSTPETDDGVTPAPKPSVGETTTDTPRDEPTARTLPQKQRDDVFEIGERTGEIEPLDVAVRNATGAERTATLRITDRDSGESVHEESYTITTLSGISGEIREPGNYEIHVTVDDEHVVETIEEGLFDTCNSYGTTVTIEENGTLSVRTMTTLVLCNAETVTNDGPVNATTDSGGNA